MKKGQNGNPSGTQANNYIMQPMDERNLSRISNDVMTRRMKNRERQRRYRARKRLEADNNKPSIAIPSTQLEVGFPQNGSNSRSSSSSSSSSSSFSLSYNNFSTNVQYCSRKWKKEARVMAKKLNITSDNQTSSIMEPELGRSESYSEVIGGTQKKVMGRRDWKAEARGMMLKDD